MAILLRLTFPGGRYHATPWGRHVNEGVPEWPPSPWRLLRALVAVWKRTCPDLSEAAVKRVLEQLAMPPHFRLPPHRAAHTRHYMPWEKKGPQDRTLVFDTFVTVGRDDPLWIGWLDGNLDRDGERCLRRIVSNLSVLGRAETMVEASLADGAADGAVDWNCVPANESAANPLPVLCPDSATCFASEHYPSLDPVKLAKGKVKPAEYLFDCPPWHLCLDTETIHAERWPVVPGSRWVNYTRPDEARRRTMRRDRRDDSTMTSSDRRESRGLVENRGSLGAPTVARFVIDGPSLPLATDTLTVAEAVRRAAMSCFGRWCLRHPEKANDFRRTDAPDRFASPILSGKDARGVRLEGPGHAHYWPYATDVDHRHIRGVAIFARAGFGAEEIAALAAMRTLQIDERMSLRIQLIGLGAIESLDSALVGPSATWRSSTPFLGHAEIGVRGQSRYLRKGLRREWKRLAAQLPEYHGVELVDVSELAAEEITRLLGIQPREFRRTRWKHGGREAYRPGAMFRLVFSQAITGPFSLGYANHFGMGAFVKDDSL